MKQLKVKSSALKRGFFCLLVVPFMFNAQQLQAQLTGYTYAKTVTIQASQVAGTLTNFPVLVSVTDNSLRTVANGGNVQNANGYDIVFSLSDCSTILSHQIEKYDAATGQFVAWVNVPSLSSAANTPLYMFYGNSSVTTDPSTTAVWDANYMGVWHFNNSVNDGSSNSLHLTDHSTDNLTGSKIGDGRRLNNNPFVSSGSGSLRYLELPDNLFSTVNSFSFEGWVWLDAVTTNWERIFDFGTSTTVNMFLSPSIGNTTTGVKRFAITINGNASEQRISSTASTSTGAWHHFAVTIDAATNTGVLYYDGASNATNAAMTLEPGNLGADNANYFGRSNYTADEGLYGNFDEFRMSNTARSADWITTSYNNQNNPSAFYSVSAEVAASSLCSVLPVTITSFETVAEQDGSVTLHWITEQPLNNEIIIVERSGNGTTWEAIKTILPSANAQKQFKVQDPAPLQPVCYYRLKQIDASNIITYSSINMVKWNSAGNNSLFFVSPNPAKRNVNIAFTESILPGTRVEILNNMGMKVYVQPVITGNTISVDLPAMANGVYFVNVYSSGNKYCKKLLIAQ